MAWLGGNERSSERCTDAGHLVAWMMYSEIKEFAGNGSCNRRRGEAARGAGTEAAGV